MNCICTDNPSRLYKLIRYSKKSSAVSVPFLEVDGRVYPGSRVGDGMFDSVSTLKKQDTIHLSSSPCLTLGQKITNTYLSCVGTIKPCLKFLSRIPIRFSQE